MATGDNNDPTDWKEQMPKIASLEVRSDIGASERFPNVRLMLEGTDLVAVTVITERQARAMSGHVVEDVKRRLEGVLGSMVWTILRDIPMRQIEICGIRSVLV